MNDKIMFSIIGIGLALWVWVYVVECTWRWLKRRKLDKQVIDGVVPLDYSRKIKMLHEEVNRGDLMTDTQMRTFEILQGLRERVSHIRLQGYDAGIDNRYASKDTFALGAGNNPYPKKTGEAQQWVRGFCQAYGEPPKFWMESAGKKT